ncbi:MAG: hypothetical protein ACTSPG_02800 [Candidatus Hodarchaeales archaeon]
MIDILLFYNLPSFILLSIPIILSEVFFKKESKSVRMKYILRGFGWIILAVLLMNIIWIIEELITSGSTNPYLLSISYSGQFHPTVQHTILRTIYFLFQSIPLFILFIFAIIIARDYKSQPETDEEATYDENFLIRWYHYYFSNDVVFYNRAIPMIAVLLTDILFFTMISSMQALDISYTYQLPNLILQTFSEILFILFFVFAILVPVKVMNYRMKTVEEHNTPSFRENKIKVFYWIFGLIAGGLAVVFILEGVINDFHNFGESIYSGKMVGFTFAVVICLILVETLLILIASFIPFNKFGITGFTEKNVPMKVQVSFRSFLVVVIIILAFITTFQPIITTTPVYFTHKTAFSEISFADNPIEDYPVNISHLRLVSSDLARDISKASPPSPPLPYTLSIMDDKDMVGMIDGRPAWIIPMKYESQFNPEANVIAGYVRVFLDDPISEHIQFNFYEMQYGWGLNGYNEISYLALQIMPDAFIGQDGISFIDPYKGDPAWLLRMSRYNDWGMEIPAGVLVIQGDGSYELLSVEEATTFDPESISDSAFKSVADRAGSYIRTNQETGEFEFDFSSKGLFTIPTSPDRFIDIEIYDEYAEDEITNFYLRPHHYLTHDGNWFGRIYYRKTTTSNIENVIAISVENTSIKIYDLREYERGGLRGVHTPNEVMDDLQDEFEEKLELKSGESFLKYRVIQPTLYKTNIENETLLVWISLIIYRTQGADELRGALFVDAANTRIVGYTTRSIGEASEVFKQRLISNIEQTYLTFGTNNDSAGETQFTDIENGTIIYHDWIGQDINYWKIYVMRIWDNINNTEWRIFVRKNEAKTGQVYAMAASAMVGENYRFSLRLDKDEQVYILYDISPL